MQKISEDIFNLEQAKNFFNALARKENSAFYGSDKIAKTLIKKTRKSNYEKR